MLPLTSKGLNRIDLFGDGDFVWYKSDRHLHDFTDAFGRPEERLGSAIDKSTSKSFFISQDEPADGCVKLTGVWLAYSSESATSAALAFPIRLCVNGTEVWSGLLHLPIVCAGWPSVYLNIPAGCLHHGHNELSLNIDGPALLLNQFSLFFHAYSGQAFEVLHSPRVLTTNSDFSITLQSYRKIHDLDIECTGPIELVDPADGCEIGENDFFFRTLGDAGKCSVSFASGNERFKVNLPTVLDLPKGLPCYVGSDSDDHPHDGTGTMEEIISHLFRSETGNMVMFRPKETRNCVVSPSESLCRSWIDLCHRFHAKYFVCDWVPSGKFPDALQPAMAEDPDFLGYHVHEPYFMMHDRNSNEEFKSATDYNSAKNAYIRMLSDMAERYHSRGAKVAAGEASWIAAYDGEAGFDIINAEAVTGFGPLFGSARGAMRGRSEMTFGHHIAIEWYLGFPYDDLKSHRFWLMMLLTFTHGGTYIYAENSLFFTNSYERHDPEDKFTSDNRELMRRFYDMTRLQPRFGEPCAELAVAYGNLESILWHHDDLLPEEEDGSTWMESSWYKWDGAPYKPAWRALDAWLTPVEIERYNANKSILKWFSGNPYGNVDIVSTDRSSEIFSMYKVLAFLGWNTMTEDVLDKLKTYVSGGGALFIGGCQFDKRTLSLGDYEIDTSGAEDLLGLAVTGVGNSIGDVVWNGSLLSQSNETRLCSLNIKEAEVVASDELGNPVLLHHKYGDGEVYFYNLWDHPVTAESIELIKAFMAHLGNENKCSFGVEDGYGVNCSHWYDSDSGIRRLYLVNTNWQRERTSRVCTVRLWGNSYPISIKDDNMTVVTVKGRTAVITDNPYVYVKDITVDPSECHVTMTGNSNCTVRLLFVDSNIKVAPQPMSGPADLMDECIISCSPQGTLELMFDLQQA